MMCCRFNPEGGLLAVGLVNGVTKVKQLGFFGIIDLSIIILTIRSLIFFSTIFTSLNIISVYVSLNITLILSSRWRFVLSLAREKRNLNL